MPSGNFSNDDVALVKYFGKKFVEELFLILQKIENQDLLDTIVRDMQMILENSWFVFQLSNSDLLPRLILTDEEINVLIKGLKLLPQYFDDWDVETRIGGSFLEIDTLIGKLERWQFGMKFNVILDDDLNNLYVIINDFIDEISDIDCQNSLHCDKQFLENLLSKIMVVMDNRIFFEKWGDSNPLEPSSLTADEIKVVIKILEKKSDQQTQELKNKLESLLL